MKRNKTTTVTHVVLQYLIALDDFATAKQIRDATGASTNNVSSALHELRHYNAVGVEEVKGVLYWYACPETDTRMRKVEERTPESKSRRAAIRKTSPTRMAADAYTWWKANPAWVPSPEPYRVAMTEAGYGSLDGTNRWHSAITLLEKLVASGK